MMGEPSLLKHHQGCFDSATTTSTYLCQHKDVRIVFAIKISKLTFFAKGYCFHSCIPPSIYLTNGTGS